MLSAVEVKAREWIGKCGNNSYTLNYTYNPGKDKMGSPWHSVLRVNGVKIKGFFIAGGDGYNFYTSDQRTAVSNRPSGHTLWLNGKTYRCN